jgi:hypothetical protein
MQIFWWVLGIHVFELIIIGMIMLIRKNRILEKTVIGQQQYIDSVSILISQTKDSLKAITDKVWLDDDPEAQMAVENLKEIQNILEDFNK